MNVVLTALYLALLFVSPIFLLGVINRTKALCTGRKGPKLYQTGLDLIRLVRKRPIYSPTTSWVFQLAPSVVLATTLVAALMTPIFPGFSVLRFPGDFVAFLYVLGLGRFFLVLSGLDTGSSFEGMGVSREVTFSALVEPAFFMVVGTFVAISQNSSFQALLSPNAGDWSGLYILAVVALFIILQTETARLPVDDPSTHLEVTMVHEVMILDHSGPDLAIVTYAAALKLTIWLGLLAAVVNPFTIATRPTAAIFSSLFLMGAFAVVVGLVESVMARLKMTTVPYYALVALGVSLMMFGGLVFRTLLQLT